jgi:hypothetical protein
MSNRRSCFDCRGFSLPNWATADPSLLQIARIAAGFCSELKPSILLLASTTELTIESVSCELLESADRKLRKEIPATIIATKNEAEKIIAAAYRIFSSAVLVRDLTVSDS